jgi:hypothetical protein
MRWLSWSMRTSEETLHPNFGESDQREVRRIRLLETWAKLFRRCPTRRNSGTSLRRSMPENSPTPPAVPCNHLLNANAEDEALG